MLIYWFSCIAQGSLSSRQYTGRFSLVVQPVQQPPHAAWRLPATMGHDAIVLLPELVFRKTPPDSVFFDVQDELGVALLDLDHATFDDRGDA